MKVPRHHLLGDSNLVIVAEKTDEVIHFFSIVLTTVDNISLHFSKMVNLVIYQE